MLTTPVALIAPYRGGACMEHAMVAVGMEEEAAAKGGGCASGIDLSIFCPARVSPSPVGFGPPTTLNGIGLDRANEAHNFFFLDRSLWSNYLNELFFLLKNIGKPEPGSKKKP